MLDAVIIGAGPAGCAAALRASARGLRVMVFDKARPGRDKTCGDGLTTNALRQLRQLGIAVDALATHAPVGSAHVVAPDGTSVCLPLPTPTGFAATVTRKELDATLTDAIAAQRIPVHYNDALVALTTDPNGVTVCTESRFTVRARYCVAADGHFSRVRRILEPERTRDLGAWHAVRQYHRNVHATDLWVVFDPALLPGYAWVFPLPDRRANVGFCVPREHRGKALHTLNARAMQILRPVLGPDATPEEATRAWPIPCSYSQAQLVDGRVLYVGDAANVVDPMTGEGIAQALETGAMAIDAIADAGAPGPVAQRYRRVVDRELGRDLRFAQRLSNILRSDRRANIALRIINTNAWTRREFARWMFEDYPRAFVGTPDRWVHRLRHRAVVNAQPSHAPHP